MAARYTPSKGAKPDKLCRDALALALNREAKGADGKPTKRLNLIADKLVRNAMGGDMTAIREIFDRIDGKVTPASAPDADGQVILTINTGIIRSDDAPYPQIEAAPQMIEDATEVVEDDELVVEPRLTTANTEAR
jgi:hypothetical protein